MDIKVINTYVSAYHFGPDCYLGAAPAAALSRIFSNTWDLISANTLGLISVNTLGKSLYDLGLISDNTYLGPYLCKHFGHNLC
jgi:hypothetical protein